MDYLEMMENFSKKIPQDVTWEGAIHQLAQMLNESTNLTDLQKSALVGIGAMMFKQGEKECLAQIPSSFKIPQ